MASHFLLSARARSLYLAQVFRMTDAQAETMFAGIRWTETNGKAVCPHCECPTCYEARRPNGALRFRCKACRKDFSLTSGTLVRLPQDEPANLPRRHRDLLQRDQGQVRPGAQP